MLLLKWTRFLTSCFYHLICYCRSLSLYYRLLKLKVIKIVRLFKIHPGSISINYHLDNLQCYPGPFMYSPDKILGVAWEFSASDVSEVSIFMPCEDTELWTKPLHGSTNNLFLSMLMHCLLGEETI